MALKASAADFREATKSVKKKANLAKVKEAPEGGFAGVDEKGVYPGQCVGIELGRSDQGAKQAYVKFSLIITEGKYKGQRGDKTLFIGKPPAEVDEYKDGVKTGKKKRLSDKERDEAETRAIDEVMFHLQKLGYDTAEFEDAIEGVIELAPQVAKNKPVVKLSINPFDKAGKKRDYPSIYLVKADQSSVAKHSDDPTAEEEEVEEETEEAEESTDEEVDESSDDEVEEEVEEEPEEEEDEGPTIGSSKYMFGGNKQFPKQQIKIVSVNKAEKKATVQLLKSQKKATLPWSMITAK